MKAVLMKVAVWIGLSALALVSLACGFTGDDEEPTPLVQPPAVVAPPIAEPAAPIGLDTAPAGYPAGIPWAPGGSPATSDLPEYQAYTYRWNPAGMFETLFQAFRNDGWTVDGNTRIEMGIYAFRFVKGSRYVRFIVEPRDTGSLVNVNADPL